MKLLIGSSGREVFSVALRLKVPHALREGEKWVRSRHRRLVRFRIGFWGNHSRVLGKDVHQRTFAELCGC